MVSIVGQSMLIAEGLSAFIPSKIHINYITLQAGYNITEAGSYQLLFNSNLIIINLDGIHEEARHFIAYCKKLCFASKIIAVDNHNSNAMAKHLIDIGASAYLPITSNGEIISKLIRELLSDMGEVAEKNYL
jgi:DNA-binding NarL/FixJ family response regulator